MHHHHSCCCDDGPGGPGPCTIFSCPNGFVDSQGNPEPTPLVGPTFDTNGEPDTCLFVLVNMQVNDVHERAYVNPPDGNLDPRLTISESWQRGCTVCFGDETPDGVQGSIQFNGCAGGINFESPFIGATPAGVPGIESFFTVKFYFTANANTNGSVSFTARYEIWNYTDANPSPSLDFVGGLANGRLGTTNAQGPSGGPNNSGMFGQGVYADSRTFTGLMVPVFVPGANGINQVVGAEINWNVQSQGTAFQNDLQFSLFTNFTGNATARLTNLRRYDPECPDEPAGITDPRILDRLNRQANGGGCRGCGDGNTF